MLSVAIVGPDGAGKTSVARALERALGRPAIYLYMGVSPESSNRVLPTTRLLRWLRRSRRAGATTPRTFGAQAPAAGSGDGAAKRLRRSLRAAAHLGNRLAEECYRQGLTWWHRKRGRVVLFDRHFFADFYTTDVEGAGRLPLSRRLHGRFLRHVYPRPDLVLYLDAPPELLRARKQEADLETLEAMRRNYERLAEAGLPYVALDARQPLDAVVAEAAAVIHHFARHRALPARAKLPA